jgi:hypothetical protein
MTIDYVSKGERRRRRRLGVGSPAGDGSSTKLERRIAYRALASRRLLATKTASGTEATTCAFTTNG